MIKITWPRCAAVLLACVMLGLVVVWARAAEPVRVDWYAIASGGSASSADVKLDGTAAQAAAGGLSSSDFRLGAGYWGDTTEPVSHPSELDIFLPLVRRG